MEIEEDDDDIGFQEAQAYVHKLKQQNSTKLPSRPGLQVRKESQEVIDISQEVEKKINDMTTPEEKAYYKDTDSISTLGSFTDGGGVISPGSIRTSSTFQLIVSPTNTPPVKDGNTFIFRTNHSNNQSVASSITMESLSILQKDKIRWMLL